MGYIVQINVRNTASSYYKDYELIINNINTY